MAIEVTTYLNQASVIEEKEPVHAQAQKFSNFNRSARDDAKHCLIAGSMVAK